MVSRGGRGKGKKKRKEGRRGKQPSSLAAEAIRLLFREDLTRG